MTHTRFRQLMENKMAESLDFIGVLPFLYGKKMLYGSTALKFF
jgi:hypothetical protein